MSRVSHKRSRVSPAKSKTSSDKTSEIHLSDLIPTDPPPPARVKPLVLADWLCVSVKTVYAWSEQGRLPRPVELGPRTRLFDVEQVRVYLRHLDDEQDLAKEEVCLG